MLQSLDTVPHTDKS